MNETVELVRATRDLVHATWAVAIATTLATIASTCFNFFSLKALGKKVEEAGERAGPSEFGN